MFKNSITSIFLVSMALFLVSACAEEANETANMVSTANKTNETIHEQASVMHQPVDFSTPEAVEKSLQKVRESAGDRSHNKLKNTMKYLLVYDLSVKHDEEQLHRKLDGMTPEEIIARRKR